MDTVKKRWKHLKDHFRKELKKRPGAAAENWMPSWQFFHLMEFIRNELIPEPTAVNIKLDPDNDSQSSVTSEIQMSMDAIEDPIGNETDYFISGVQTSTCSKPVKRSLNSIREDMLDLEIKIKLMEQRMVVSQADNRLKNDPDYMYFMSIMPDIKKLNDIQKLRFKTNVNNILLDLLTENNDNS